MSETAPEAKDGPDIVDALLGEHALFYQLFDEIEERIDDVDDVDRLQGWVAVLGSLLERHAEIEDELLFAPLEEQMHGRDPLGPLRNQHRDIEGTVQAMRSVDDSDRLRRRIHALISVARDHFLQEEQQIFPVARDLLDHRARATAGEGWAAARGVDL